MHPKGYPAAWPKQFVDNTQQFLNDELPNSAVGWPRLPPAPHQARCAPPLPKENDVLRTPPNTIADRRTGIKEN